MSEPNETRDRLAKEYASNDLGFSCPSCKAHTSDAEWEKLVEAKFKSAWTKCLKHEPVVLAMVEALENAQCECTVVERDSGHLVGCWQHARSQAEIAAVNKLLEVYAPKNITDGILAMTQKIQSLEAEVAALRLALASSTDDEAKPKYARMVKSWQEADAIRASREGRGK